MEGKIKTRLTTTVLFLIPLSLFVYTEGFADDASKGRDYFLSQCIACHAFSCNRKTDYANSPKLGGIFGRKEGGVEAQRHRGFLQPTRGDVQITCFW